jgi:hypothetical protein
VIHALSTSSGSHMPVEKNIQYIHKFIQNMSIVYTIIYICVFNMLKLDEEILLNH